MTQIVTLAGTTGKDAVAKSTQAGKELCSFSLAVNVGYGDNRQTYWWDVTRWGNGAKKLTEMLPKGTKVTVIGEVSTREHDGKTYLQCRALEVALQGERKADGGQQRSGGGGNQQRGYDSSELDDSVPF
jgi:single-strand DNA-binding protein